MTETINRLVAISRTRRTKKIEDAAPQPTTATDLEAPAPAEAAAAPLPAPAATPVAPTASAATAPTKSATVIKLLLRTRGATAIELIAATDWQPHSVRAFLSGLRKKGRVLVRKERKGGGFAYHMQAATAAAADLPQAGANGAPTTGAQDADDTPVGGAA